ncbi:hypothetical protein SM033_00145 [Vibrio phage vB_VpaM_sm033]|nr:hypothetical protein SM033_00145 [Vibrio phage vB_VpaM_sm033]
MALPGTVTASSNPFIISGSPVENPLLFQLAETSVIDDQYIVFTVEEDAGTGGGPPMARSGDGDDGGGETGPPEFQFTPKSVKVTTNVPTGLTIEEDGEAILSGKYSNGLFGGATLQYLTNDLEIVTINSWDDLPESYFSLLRFQDTSVRSVMAEFTVTAIIEQDDLGEITEIVMTETWTQEVTNNWDAGNQALKEATGNG